MEPRSQILAGPWMGCVGCVTLGPPSEETSQAQMDRGFCNEKVISTHGAPKALHNGIYCDGLTTDSSEWLLSQIPGEPGSVLWAGAVWHFQELELPAQSIPLCSPGQPERMGSRPEPAALGSLNALYFLVSVTTQMCQDFHMFCGLSSTST